MTRTRKGQTAMEYLMTYGWAILIIIIVAAALFALGVFNPGTFTQSTAVGFPNINIPVGSWRLGSDAACGVPIPPASCTTSDAEFILLFANQAGARISVTSVESTVGTSVGVNTTVIALSPNQQTAYVIGQGAWTPGLLASQGSAYTANVQIVYDNLDTGLTGFRSAGTVTGVFS